MSHHAIIEPGVAGLTREQIEAARLEARRQAISLRDSLLKLGLVNESDLLTAVSQRTSLEYVDLSPDSIDSEAAEMISAKVAAHYGVMPYQKEDGRLKVAVSDPFNPNLRRELQLILDVSLDIEFVLATSETIQKAIRKLYGVGAATVEQMVSAEQVTPTEDKHTDLTDETKAREASVVKLVNQLLADAINAGATDIHIEPYEQDLKVRYRIDGILLDAGVPGTVRFFREGIVSRIKIMSGLDIAEKRLPQDGRAQVDLGNHKFDLRISILPTRHGEAVNVRVLPQSTLITDLSALGMTEATANQITKLILKPHGILLVTGPTGSGKTTTLYTCMNKLKDTERKIITIEDPVEYDMAGLLQMQVHPNIGFTFARALRAMLRHDPDVMLVGEIRDLETAETAIRTALTGHLVFSTLHTNDAASTITRLLDMGIEPYLVASSLEAILAQCLVRTICRDCKQPYQPEPEIVTAIRSLAEKEECLRHRYPGHRWPEVYRGKGCAACRFTGYRGRTVVTELLVLSDAIRDITIARRHATEIDTQARKEGMASLFHSALSKAHEGITTYEEVLRVSKGII